MTEIQRIVDEIVPPLYDGVRDQFGYTFSNMAASNQCHVLTRGLWIELNNRNIESRREYHETPDDIPYHFVVAHTPIDAEPTEDDLITDLNP